MVSENRGRRLLGAGGQLFTRLLDKLQRTYGEDPLQAWAASQRGEEEKGGLTFYRLRQHAQAIEGAEATYVRHTRRWLHAAQPHSSPLRPRLRSRCVCVCVCVALAAGCTACACP
jgi:hypothetical protein